MSFHLNAFRFSNVWQPNKRKMLAREALKNHYANAFAPHHA
ncbi:hypothetical protein RMSM_06391 [Rhodopirellula maiorica SM1]|uniref:Uncharacterized protein n=1 Tax=Rhodopirellula maiorica SM1 TaxID=1265738 RepID=M5RRV7_9BACT|nr:hypothetical protein RMSM_06391 [Rhodopirellula maiorica SM1]